MQTATLSTTAEFWTDAEAFSPVGDERLFREMHGADSDHAWANALDRQPTLAKTSISDQVDLIRRYLTEMGAVRRLTFAEEVALAKRIEEGRTGRRRNSSASRMPVQGPAEESPQEPGTLWTQRFDPDEARAHMIRANLRLVVSIAKQFSGGGLSLLDLIQEGNVGLMKAVDRFDWRRGCRFGTYASWWIKQSISRAISDQGRMIRLPAHIGDSINRVDRLRQSWIQLYEEEPPPEELSAVARVRPERIEQIDQLTTTPVSLDWLLPDGERTVGDLLPDDASVPPIDVLVERQRDHLLRGSLSELTTRERRVLLMHFGIGQPRAYTLEEIGQKFRLTRERIRQIELKALNKLRHPSRSQHLKEFVAATAGPGKSSDGGEISIDDGF
jgi:RNA polymerase primary sigma factor